MKLILEGWKILIFGHMVSAILFIIKLFQQKKLIKWIISNFVHFSNFLAKILHQQLKLRA